MLPKIKNSQAYGNEEVVKLLELWLERAREGQICHATITVCQLPNLMASDFAGVADMDFAVPYALDTLKLKLGERARISSGPPDKGLTADYVCYNLGSSPKSFDFLVWLVDAEMTRIREGVGPLKVAFTKGQDGKSGLGNTAEQQMFVNVMRPLVKLIGGIEDQAAVGGRSNPWYVLRNVTEASRKGERVPVFKASKEARATVAAFLEGGPPPITITLRELDSWKHRNSNLEAWMKFARSWEMRGERIIFIRDTAKAGEPLLGFETFPLASLNLDIRMALYEQAKCNLFVPSGPWNLALFGTRPWLMFNKISEDDPYLCNRPKFWTESQGLSEGEQFPWCGPEQRIVWAADTYENISEAWSWLVQKSSQQHSIQETIQQGT